MKNILVALFTFFVLPVVFSVFACADIQSISVDKTTIKTGEKYTCIVTVDGAHAGSKSIACGVSFDSGFPFDFCSSKEFFGGWSGANGRFNCIFPNTNIPDTIKKVELVGYDFSPGCGPDKAKRVSISLEKNPATTITATPEQQEPQARSALSVLFEALFGSDIKSGTGTTIQPTGGAQTTSSPQPSTPVVTGSVTVTNETIKTLLQTDTAVYTADLMSDVKSECLQNVAVYKEASTFNGVPWPVLAGIHFREVSCSPNNSLASGAAIGTPEPNSSGDYCSSSVSGPGVPAPMGGGCGFRTLLDSAIWAGDHLKGKNDTNGGRVPATFPELTRALARYNGSGDIRDGNANCGKHAEAIKSIYGYSVAYTNCPAQFWGDDNPYVMNKFDSSHNSMSILFCYDGTYCDYNNFDKRPGTATAARIMAISAE